MSDGTFPAHHAYTEADLLRLRLLLDEATEAMRRGDFTPIVAVFHKHGEAIRNMIWSPK